MSKHWIGLRVQKMMLNYTSNVKAWSSTESIQFNFSPTCLYKHLATKFDSVPACVELLGTNGMGGGQPRFEPPNIWVSSSFNGGPGCKK